MVRADRLIYIIICCHNFSIIQDLKFVSFQDFTFIFYPIALTISSIFLLATIFVYFIDPDLHKPLFGKITLSFVINNLVAYICLIGQYLGEYFESLATNSFACILTGYLILYTFTTFMFWINAMAANIFFKFSSIMSSSSENSGVKFVLYLIYAQGAPLLLCLIVFLMDMKGPCSMVRPNMGVAHCFLGDPWGAQVTPKKISKLFSPFRWRRKVPRASGQLWRS